MAEENKTFEQVLNEKREELKNSGAFRLLKEYEPTEYHLHGGTFSHLTHLELMDLDEESGDATYHSKPVEFVTDEDIAANLESYSTMFQKKK